VHAIAEPAEARDPAYAEGLRAAIAAAVGYGIEIAERGEERSPPPPPILLAQARLAARNRIALETVLRRYFAGHALLGDCLVEEAERAGIDRAALRRLLRAQAALFDRLLAAVSEEHRRESAVRIDSSERRRAERVERLLAGESIEAGGLGYEFDACHLGLIAQGPGAAEAVRELAGALDQRLLLLAREEGELWAWLGSRREVDPAALKRSLEQSGPPIVLASGEPADGLAGWRFSHRQAKAAFPIAKRGRERFVRYSDVALLASILGDDLLATSLRELYLKPLERERDGGEVLRETLRAYFAAGRNASSAAVALGVNRNTMTNRLRAIEQHLGRSLGTCAVGVEAALSLEALTHLASSEVGMESS
jgi:hypothetical protein